MKVCSMESGLEHRGQNQSLHQFQSVQPKQLNLGEQCQDGKIIKPVNTNPLVFLEKFNALRFIACTVYENCKTVLTARV